MDFCSLMVVNKMADLYIDFGLSFVFWSSYMKKIRDSKNERVQYRNSQIGRKDGWKNKINSMEKGNMSFELSIYDYKIHGYQQRLIILR